MKKQTRSITQHVLNFIKESSTERFLGMFFVFFSFVFVNASLLASTSQQNTGRIIILIIGIVFSIVLYHGMNQVRDKFFSDKIMRLLLSVSSGFVITAPLSTIVLFTCFVLRIL